MLPSNQHAEALAALHSKWGGASSKEENKLAGFRLDARVMLAMMYVNDRCKKQSKAAKIILMTRF